MRTLFASAPQRGIAIGPILMIVALVAIIVAAFSQGSGDISGAMRADQMTAELRAQADQIRAKIQECVFITRTRATVALQADPVTGLMPADTRTDLQKGYEYPTVGTVTAWASGANYSAGNIVVQAGRYYAAVTSGAAGSTAPTHTSGSVSDGNIMWDYLGTTALQPVRFVECPRDPAGRRNLWSGQRPATLPAPPRGFTEWVYVDHGDPMAVNPGGTCIRIQPLPETASDMRVREAISKMVQRFAPSEVTYNPASTDQRIIIWLRRPQTGTAC